MQNEHAKVSSSTNMPQYTPANTKHAHVEKEIKERILFVITTKIKIKYPEKHLTKGVEDRTIKTYKYCKK